MPSATPSSSSTLPASASLYPLAIIDVGSDSLRLCLQPSAPAAPSAALTSSKVHRCPNASARTRPPSKQVYIGSAIEERCNDYSGLVLRLPIERGLITDWVAQKAIWDVEIAKALRQVRGHAGGGKLLEGWNLIITEAYFNLPELEVGLETMLFEEYRVRGIWRTTAAQLASFAPIGVEAQVKAKAKGQENQHVHSQGEEALKPPPPASSPLSSSPSKDTASSPQPPPAKRPRRSAAASSPTSPPPASSESDVSKRSKSSAFSGPRQPRRPEATLIIDLGNSAIHAVPLLHNEPIWRGVKRLELGGKVMTNLLKEQISFKQWDMTDESWLMARLKERAFFVAASEYEEPLDERPSSWTPKMLLQRSGAIEQEWVLPDYMGNKGLARDVEKRYGHMLRGPGLTSVDGADDGEAAREDAFIADLSALQTAQEAQRQGSESEDDEDEEDDGDYCESGSEDDDETSAPKPAPKPASVAPAKKKGPAAQDPDDDEQRLLLSHERWQIPEILFRPEQLGLTSTLPLPSLILSAAQSAAEGDDALLGLLLCNITLTGGLASMPGLRRRVEADLRAIAPTECLVRVRTLEEAEGAAIEGARWCPAKFVQGKLMAREQWEQERTQGSRAKFGSWSATSGGGGGAGGRGRGGSTQLKGR